MPFGNFFKSFFYFSGGEKTRECRNREYEYVAMNFDLDEFDDIFVGPHTRITDIDSILDDCEHAHNFARCL